MCDCQGWFHEEGCPQELAFWWDDNAQHSMHWTGGESAPLQAESTPEVLSPSLAVSARPTCQ